MKYNIKVCSYLEEVQLNFYVDGITYKTDEEKEIEKNVKIDFENSTTGVEYNKQVAERLAFVDSYSEILNTCISPFDNETLLTRVKEFKNSDNVRRSTTRTKQTIYEYSRANKWDYFATFTFEGAYRYDYQACKKKLTQFFNNFIKRKCPSFKYLAVPEKHKDGAWHFHALIQCCDLKDWLVNGFHKGRYVFTPYKLGINEFEPVRDSKRVSMYITKYITKDLVDDTKGSQRFLVSKGLKKADIQKFDTQDSLLEFIDKYFSEYEITYSKFVEQKGCYDYSANYIQLRKV